MTAPDLAIVLVVSIVGGGAVVALPSTPTGSLLITDDPILLKGANDTAAEVATAAELESSAALLRVIGPPHALNACEVDRLRNPWPVPGGFS